MSRTDSPGRTPEQWGLWALYLFTAIALTGFTVFGLNPGRLPASEWIVGIYRVSFRMFSQIQIILASVVLGIALVRYVGLRWIPAFLGVMGLSFLAEHVGTGYGIPFSGYGYSGLLGYKVGGRVPWLIPVSWFLMALPSYVIARHFLDSPSLRHRLGRVVAAAMLLVVWDLSLDPAMSYLTTYWLWDTPGRYYYGMPLVNLAGWLLTGLVIMAFLEAVKTRAWAARLPVKWTALYYAGVTLMPMGMCIAAGLWGVPLATLGGLALTWGVIRAFGPSVPAVTGASEQRAGTPDPTTSSSAPPEVRA
jgi:putative membrane protein